ncbi:hypothetical protein HDV00_011451 [Rhizophlyctis rosea]|nr:hypothetical protein HDV00_011451 [Rhizophlyctis rosea]
MTPHIKPVPPANLKEFLSELQSLLPADSVNTDARELDRNAKDPSYHDPVRPYAVVSVTSEADMVNVARTCNKYGIPIIPSAGRTSLEGHVIPTSRGGITLDVSSMDKIVKINDDDLDVVVQPGIGWMELKEKLEPLGLFFPPDPGAAACVGGMCGTNCSGTLAWRYGTMKDNVLSLRVVLPDVQQLVKAGIALHRMELMDKDAIRSVNAGRSNKADHFPEHVTLLLELAAASEATIREQSEAVRAICEKACKHRSEFAFTIGSNKEEAERLWIIRKTAYFAAKNLRPELGTRVRIMTTDSAVPISRIREMLVKTREDLDSHGLTATILAHVGDGNFHVLLVIDPENEKELQLAEAFRLRNAAAAIAMDGTCTGEHGVGTGKIELLEMEVGPETVDLMRRIKKVVDPKGIMNPGKIFHLEASKTGGAKAKL